MAYLKFLNSEKALKCNVKPIGGNVVSLSFNDKIVVNESGFNLYLDEDCSLNIGGDTYKSFKTIYRNDDYTAEFNGYQLSNDGSVYVEPKRTVKFVAGSGGELSGDVEQEVYNYDEVIAPIPIENENYVFSGWNPELPISGVVENNITYTALFEYVPTLQEEKDKKIVELNEIQQQNIRNGLDITLSDGTVEHFTITDHDQTSLMGLQTRVIAGDEQIPWHDSDIETGCKYYSNADMAIITEKAMAFVTWHVTYFINLRVYVLKLESKEEVNAIEYGVYIPEEYQDEVMRDLYALA